MGNQIASFDLQLFKDDAKFFGKKKKKNNNFPTCWDELLDWTDETSFLFRIYLNNNNTNNSFNDEKLSGIKFIPYIRKERLKKNDDTIIISSMNDIERIEFFKEHVRKVFVFVFVLVFNKFNYTNLKVSSFSRLIYHIYIGCYSIN